MGLCGLRSPSGFTGGGLLPPYRVAKNVAVMELGSRAPGIACCWWLGDSLPTERLVVEFKSKEPVPAVMQNVLELELLAPQSLRLLLQSLQVSGGDGKDGVMLGAVGSRGKDGWETQVFAWTVGASFVGQDDSTRLFGAESTIYWSRQK